VETHVEVSREIAAAPEKVWDAITDVARMGEWSPECHTCQWVGDAEGPSVGARFQGQNRNGDHEWTTEAEIIELDAPRRFVFEGVVGDYHFSRWGYVIEPTDSGCTVTEIWDELRSPDIIEATTTISGVTDRAPHNRAGMELTLERLAAAIE
jgi:uncharacterized protein YndB with AHSA1/START domain